MNISLWWVTGFFINIFEFFILNDFITVVFEKKETRKKLLPLVYFFAAIILLYVNSLQITYLDLLTSVALIYTILLGFFVGNKIYMFANVIIFLVPAILGEILIKIVLFSIFAELSSFTYIAINTLSMIFSFLIIKVYLKTMYRTKYDAENKHWFFLYFIVAISNMIIIICVLYIFNMNVVLTDNAPYILSFVCFCVLFSNTAGFYFLENMLIHATRIKEMNLISQKAELERNYYVKIDEKTTQQAFLIHDIKHHMSVISGMAQQGENADIINYINKAIAKFSKFETIQYTNNKILNIIISEKKKIAECKGIEFDIDIHPCDCSNIDSYDMCAIFSNIVDNAIEAAAKCSHNKFIKLKISPFNSHFIFMGLINTYAEKPLSDGEKLLSTKRNREGHGLGLEHAKRLTENINSIFEREYADGIFKVTILFSVSKGPNFHFE